MAENFSELGRVEAIAKLYEGSGYTPFKSSIFTPAAHSRCAQASKTLLEGIDFDLTYFPLKHLGYKSIIAVTGELYAALAQPRCLDVKLGISAKLEFSHIGELWSGIILAAKEHGYKSVALDLNPSYSGLCIAISALGESSMTFTEAKSMDLICISNNLGGAYLGFSVLEKEKRNFEKTSNDAQQPKLDDYKTFIEDYLKPSIRPETLRMFKDAGITPSYGYFVTRGLSDAVKRLVRDSRLGAKIYIDRIPFEGNSFELGKKLNIDPVTAALNGGDDYRLLFTIPIGKHEKFRHDFQSYDVIGHLAKKDVGGVLVTPDGVELPLRAQGWPREE